jgi:hypothetical protein
MSLPDFMISAIKEKSKSEMNLHLKNNKKELTRTRTELLKCEEYIHNVEEKWIKNQIAFETYDRWFGDTIKKRTTLKAKIELYQEVKMLCMSCYSGILNL